MKSESGFSLAMANQTFWLIDWNGNFFTGHMTLYEDIDEAHLKLDDLKTIWHSAPSS